MKKTAFLTVCLVTALVLVTSASAKSILSAIPSVEVIDNGVKEVTRRDVLERVAREAKASQEAPKPVASMSSVTQTAEKDYPMMIHSGGIRGGSLLASVRSDLIN